MPRFGVNIWLDRFKSCVRLNSKTIVDVEPAANVTGWLRNPNDDASVKLIATPAITAVTFVIYNRNMVYV